MSYNDNPYIAHYGVLGMRWGRRMHRSAAAASDRDAADLRSKGYREEANAVQKVADSHRAKADALDIKISERELARASARKEKLLKKGIREGRITVKGGRRKALNLSKDDFSKLANSPEMANKIKNYADADKRRRIASAALLATVAIIYAAPLIVRAGDATYRYAGAKKYQRMYDMYGGFDPKVVVNAKFH